MCGRRPGRVAGKLLDIGGVLGGGGKGRVDGKLLRVELHEVGHDWLGGVLGWGRKSRVDRHLLGNVNGRVG